MNTTQHFLKISTCYGKPINIPLPNTHTTNVKDIKSTIHDQEGIPIEMQDIYLNGKIASNDHICDISSKLSLTLKLNGGASIMTLSPCSCCCGPCCAPCMGKYAGIVRRDDIRNPAIFEKDAIQDPVVPSHNCCVDFSDSIDINVSNKLKCCLKLSCLYIGMFICPCLYCIACYNAWNKEEDRLKEMYWSNKAQYLRSKAVYLDQKIINNWAEYERMFENIAWKGYLGFIDATAINSISNPRHYTMMNTIFENTNNTPSRIRDKQTLIEVLNEKETYKYPLFIFLKCESIDVWKWLKSLGLERYYENFICNGYCDLSLVLTIANKDDLLAIDIKNKNNQQMLLQSIGKITQYDENIHYKWRKDATKSIMEMSSLFVGKLCKGCGYTECLDVKCSECKTILWQGNDKYYSNPVEIPNDDDTSNSYLTSLLHN